VVLERNEVWLAPSVSKMAQCGDSHGQDMEITIMSHEIEERVAAFLGKGLFFKRAKPPKDQGTQSSAPRVGRGA
jgi:hypothetical protein